MASSITGSEKQNTAVGHGINLLEALRVSKEFISTTPIFDMDNITVDSITETHSDVVVITENSKVDLAKSLSISAGLEAKYMAFSASVDTEYKSSFTSSEERAYTKLISRIKKKRHFFHDSSYVKRLDPDFSRDLYSADVSPADLFSTYGTHFIREAGVGGTITMNLITSKDKSESKESLSVKAKASFGELVSGHYNHDQDSTTTKFLERSEYSFFSDGGKDISSLTIDEFMKEYPNWVDYISNKPDTWEFCYLPSSNSLLPIWQLCRDSARRKQLKSHYEIEAAKIMSNLANAETFVSEIRINSASKKPNAYHADQNFTLVDQDLNEKAGGNYIYLQYRTQTLAQINAEGRKPITNLVLMKTDKALRLNKCRIADGNGRLATYYRIDVDLNERAGGKYIYLWYTYDTVYSPLTAIDAYVNDERPTSNEWSTVYWNGTFSIADVNYDAGGKYIYILQKHKQ